MPYSNGKYLNYVLLKGKKKKKKEGGVLKKKKIKEISSCHIQILLGTTKALPIREEAQACWDFGLVLAEKAEKSLLQKEHKSH